MRQRSVSTRPARDATGLDLATPLLRWFRRGRRDLPWRVEGPGGTARDPYRVWVSEVMLQQTRVDVVVPYFERFVARFPTLSALAQAPLDEVLSLWSGLGYYARARNLHRAAQAAVALAKPGEPATLPGSARALEEFPGFGPYTAAAVASLAFGEDVALVDGNVARVLSRVLRLPGDPAQARAAAWREAPRLLPRGEAGPFNEALMELGATVCTPRSPSCLVCPLSALCGARAGGDPEAFPAPKARRERPRVSWAALLVRSGAGEILLARRPDGALFGGLWELPSAPIDAGCTEAQALAAVALAHGLPAAVIEGATSAGEVSQTLTHRELTLRLFAAAGAEAAEAEAAEAKLPRPLAGGSLRWVAPEGLAALGLSSLAAKSLRACGIATPVRPRRR